MHSAPQGFDQPPTTSPFLAAYRLGLSMRDAAVLEALVAPLKSEDEEGATVALSQYELAKLCGMSPTAVQRSLTALRDAGCIARKQEERRSGCIALTVVLPKVWGLFGLDRAAPAVSIPREIAEKCILQSRSAIAAMATAFESMDASIQLEDFTGRAEDADAIIATMRETIAKRGEETLQRDMPPRRIDGYAAEGQPFAIDLEAFEALAPSPVSATFLADVLPQIFRSKRVNSAEQIVNLLAEAAYSRSQGFVRGHTTKDAGRVLVNVMSKASWQRPFKIAEGWYRAATFAARTAGFSTASAVSVH